MAKINYEKDVKIDESKAQVDINIKVKPEEYARIWEMAAERMASRTTMPGFRKGKVPVSAVKASKANEISENAFNDMVNTIVQEIVSEADKKPVSTVRITVVEHDHDESDPNHDHNIEFSLGYAYRVPAKLPNFEEIKVSRPKVDVSDEELKQSMEMLMKSVNEAPAREGEEKVEITEWNDENVSLLNIPDVKTVEDLKNLIRSEVEKQKSYETEMQYRANILDEIVKRSEVVIPEMLLEDMMMQQEQDYQARIEKLGFEYEKYLQEKNINMEELKKEWKEHITGDLARELILTQYVDDNKIVPTEEEIDQAVKNADQQLKDRYTPEGLRQYLSYVISNNVAFSKIYATVSEDEEEKTLNKD